jgi:hypothetical protein
MRCIPLKGAKPTNPPRNQGVEYEARILPLMIEEKKERG